MAPSVFYRKLSVREGFGSISIPKPIVDLFLAKGCSHVRITVSKGEKLVIEAV